MATWKIENLHVAQTSDYADVVTHVDWACEGNHPINGRLTLDAPGQRFTAYFELVESQVLSWVWAKLNKGAIEAKVNAPVVPPSTEAVKPLLSASDVKPLPWGK
jgi:hypothetical protein